MSCGDKDFIKLFKKFIDHLDNDNDLIHYNREDDTIYFNVNNNWIKESEIKNSDLDYIINQLKQTP